MDISFEDKIVEVDNDKNYYILKQKIFNNKIYLFANLLEDEETPGKEFFVLRVENTKDDIKIIPEDDMEIVGYLLNEFSAMM